MGTSIINKLTPTSFNNLTFLEVRKDTLPLGLLNDRIKLIVENGFTFKEKDMFDLVVSNPPYLLLTARQSFKLGIDWNHAKKFGRNLFSLGINKCLEACKPGGIVAVIAPFGYLRGINSAIFREELERSSYEVSILAMRDRNLFQDVSQDIAFQLFKKRDEGGKNA